LSAIICMLAVGCQSEPVGSAEPDAAVVDASADASDSGQLPEVGAADAADTRDAAPECTDAGDCFPNEVCRQGECVFDGCVAQEACEEFCHQKLGRCIEQECADAELYEAEMEACINGVTAGPVAINGCLDRAAASQEACEAVAADADALADQACDSEEQTVRRCRELISYRYMGPEAGHEALAACGCQPTRTAQTCTVGDDDGCDDYGEGVCAAPSGRSEGTCTAYCEVPPRIGPGVAIRDATCGENGFCRTADDFGVCERHCVSLDDCTADTYCIPLYNTQVNEGGSSSGEVWTGSCDNGSLFNIDPPFEFCRSHADCQDGRCRQGTCHPPCTDNDDCPYGDCVDEGSEQFCDIDWADEVR
jgi:hypothetical protein